MINKAVEAKVKTTLGAVKEDVHFEYSGNLMSENGKNASVEQLLADGKVRRTVKQEGDKYYIYYALKPGAYESMKGMGSGTPATLKDVFLVDDKFNIKYIDSSGKEYGDKLENKVLEDETEIRFSSPSFAAYVSKISGKAEEEMKFKWMKDQTSLTINDKSVDSLDDLVFFPNLTSLTLGDTNLNCPQITTLDGIENCIKLKTIHVFYGQDKDYTALSYLPNLTSFYRAGGKDYNNIIDSLKLCNTLETFTIQYSTINNMSRISELGNLKSLNLQGNKITKIEGLENKINLTGINLSGNQLSNANGLESLTNLTTLYLSNNKITTLEGLEKLTNLKTLYLSNNNISNILPLSANNALLTLDLKGNVEIDGNRNNYTGEELEALNKIGKILDRKGVINIDVDKIGLFTNYKELDLSSQGLTTLESLKGLTELTSLTLNYNPLTLEDEKSQNILKDMTNLNTLNLSDCNVTNITAINELKNLKKLNLSVKTNINLKDIEDIISNLDQLLVSTENLKTIVNCDPDKITRLKLNYIGYTGVDEIPDLSKFTKLVELDLTKNSNVMDFNCISNIISLQKLTLNNCNLHGKMLDFSKLTNLTSLNLSGNTLWTEDLTNLAALKNNKDLSINLSNNSIIDASSLIALDPSCKINLRNNINLSQESKDTLKNHFKENVTF